MLGSNFIKRRQKLQIVLIATIPLLIAAGLFPVLTIPQYRFSDSRTVFFLLLFFLLYIAPVLTLFEFIACYHTLQRSRRKVLTGVLLTFPALFAAIYDLFPISIMFEGACLFISAFFQRIF